MTLPLTQNSQISPDAAEFAAPEGMIVPPGNLESDEPELESDLHRGNRSLPPIGSLGMEVNRLNINLKDS